MKLYERIENNNFDEIDRNRAIELIEGGNGHLVYNENYFKLQKENEEIRIKNNAIKRESEAYAEYMIRLDNELNLEKEKSKYEWIRQNCLSQELVNKLYIPIQKIKDKIEELQKEYNKLDKQVDEYIKSVEKDVSTYYENKERISTMQTLSYFIDILQELIEEREEK